MGTLSLDEAIAGIAKHGHTFRKSGDDRLQLLEAARRLIALVELPDETMRRMTEAEPALYATIRTAVDLHIFEKLEAAGVNGATSTELAASSGADAELICPTKLCLILTNYSWD